MDAHYHKVMKAREAVSDTGTRLYFAYSAVLDSEAFETWRAEHSYEFFNLPDGQLAEAAGLDIVFDFPSRWWGGRVAGLAEKKDSKVYGLLFEIAAKDWPIVQHKEGVVTGMSIERTIPVRVGDTVYEATAFTTTPSRASEIGPISERFIESLVRGAKDAQLPTEYIERLKNFL